MKNEMRPILHKKCNNEPKSIKDDEMDPTYCQIVSMLVKNVFEKFFQTLARHNMNQWIHVT
jgi:hypothetical protein